MSLIVASLLAAPASAQGSDEFVLFAPSTSVHVAGVRTTPDGGFLVAGNERRNPNDANAFLLRVDSGGNIVSSRAIDAQQSSSVSLARTGSGALAWTTRIRRASDASSAGVVQLLSPFGDVVWRKTSPDLPSSLALGVTLDDGVLFTTNRPLSGADYESVVTMADSAGNVRWSVAFDPDHRVIDVLGAPDGGAWVMGVVPAAVWGATWIVRLRPDGSLAWQDATSQRSHEGTDILALDMSGNVVATTVRGDGNPTLFRWADDGTRMGNSAWYVGATAADPVRLSQWTHGDGALHLAASRNRGEITCRVNADLSPATCTTIVLDDPFVLASLEATPSGLLLGGKIDGNVDAGLVLRTDLALAPVAPCVVPGNASESFTAADPFGSTWPPPMITPVATSLVDFVVGERERHGFTRSFGGDAFENDDTTATAYPIIGGDVQVRDFCDDVTDWVVIQTDAGTTYDLTTSQLGTAADTVIDLYAADGVTLLGSDDDGGGAPASHLTYSPTSSGSVLAVVRQKDGTHGPDRDYVLSLTGVTSPLLRWSRTQEFGEFRSVVDTPSGPVVGTSASLEHLSPEGRPLGRENGLGWVGAARDGGYFASGAIPGSAAWILRRAPDGTTAWTQGLTYVRRQMFSALVEAADGDLIAGGADTPGGAVARFATDGALRWCTTLNFRIANYQAAVAELAGGDIAYATILRPPSGNFAALVVRLSPQGAILGAWQVDASTAIEWLAGIVPTSDGGLMLAACERSPLASSSDGESVVLRLDPSMGLSWAKRLASASYVHVMSTAPAPGGGMLLAGAGVFAPDFAGDALVASIGESGDIPWSSSVHSGYYHDGFWSITPARDGSLLAGGRGGSGTLLNDNWGAWAARLGSRGELPTRCAASAEISLAVTPEPITVTPITMLPGTFSIGVQPATPALTNVASDDFATCLEGTAPEEVSPREAAILLMVATGGALTWDLPGPSGSEAFNVYRGPIAGLRRGDYGSCLAPLLVANVHVDPAEPPPGDPWFYLVSGRNRFGEGPLTRDSFGERHGTATPCP